jgi:hypothetical protein
VTPGPVATGKEGGAGGPIDTSITVHQGRRTIKDIKESLLKKPKIAVAPATGLKLDHIHIHLQGPLVGPDGGLHRNAVGTVVIQAVKHGNAATGGAAAPTTTSVAAPTTTTAAPQGSGAIIHDPSTKAPGGNVPVVNSSPGAPQIGNHASGTAALAIVTARGPSINGTGMIRPGSGAGVIGGPAKIAGGFISGSSFRPRHP